MLIVYESGQEVLVFNAGDNPHSEASFISEYFTESDRNIDYYDRRELPEGQSLSISSEVSVCYSHYGE